MSDQQPGDKPLKFKNNMTPLMVAAHLGRQDVCEWLMGRTWHLHKSLTISDQDKEGKNCIRYAEQANQGELAKWLTKWIRVEQILLATNPALPESVKNVVVMIQRDGPELGLNLSLRNCVDSGSTDPPFTTLRSAGCSGAP